jgi:hypothetical protein
MTASSNGEAAPDDHAELEVQMHLANMSALSTVLFTLNRLGCRIVDLQAARLQATVSLFVPRHLAHRVGSCLDELIEVVEVSAAAPC